MKRWLIAIALTALATALVVAALPRLVSTDAARDHIAAQLSRMLDARITVGGEPRLMLFPQVRVALADVHAENADLGLSADILRVDAELDIVALLTGRIEPVSFLLREPAITMPAGLLAGSTAEGSASEPRPVSQANFLPGVRREMAIRGGRLTLMQDHGLPTRITAIDANLDWPGTEGGATLSGQMRLRGETIELRAKLSDTAALFEETTATLSLAMASPALRATFEGALSGVAALQAEGTLSVAVPNLRRVLGWNGLRLGNGATLGTFALEGEARVDRRGIMLSTVKTELDGNSAEGALSLGFGGERPALKGSLASEKLDLTSYYSEITKRRSRAAEADETGSEQPLLPLALVDAADLDLQVSARQIRIGEVRVGQTALSALIQDRNLSLEIGQAVLYGGTLTGRLSAAPAQDGQAGPGRDIHTQVDLKARGISLGALPLDFWSVRPVEGTGELSISAQGRGATLAQLLAGLQGTVRGQSEKMVLNGFDLANVIETFAGGDPARGTGTTAFETLTFAADFAGGLPGAAPGSGGKGGLEFTEIAAAGAETRIRAWGHMSFADLTLALSGEALHATAGGKPARALPFLVRGPLAAPQFLPDLNRLIESGGASLAN